MGPRFGSDKIKMRRLFPVWSRLGSSNTAPHPLSPTSDRRHLTLYNTRINDGARNMDAIYLVLRWVSQEVWAPKSSPLLQRSPSLLVAYPLFRFYWEEWSDVRDTHIKGIGLGGKFISNILIEQA